MCNFFISISEIEQTQYAKEQPTMAITRTILSQSTRLVCEQVGNTTQLFGQGARAHDGVWDLMIILNLVRINRLSHIEIDTKTSKKCNVLAPYTT
jgi:hypothetical protein